MIVADGLPGTPVSVFANNRVFIKDIVFGTTTTVALNPGKHALAIRKYGAAPKSKAILATTLKVTGGENATIVANPTARGALTLNVFANPTSTLPMGDALVIVRHVTDVPTVDFCAGATTAPALISNLANPSSATPAHLPAGNYLVNVFATGTTMTSGRSSAGTAHCDGQMSLTDRPIVTAPTTHAELGVESVGSVRSQPTAARR